MKFSFSLIKKIAPGKYTKEQLVEKLNLYSFEASDLGGDTLEISIPANRHSDAASHFGIAREAAVIFNAKLNLPTSINLPAKQIKFDSSLSGTFGVNIKDKNLCRRYLAAYVTGVKVGQSPKWLKDILEACGLRSINNVVDIINYVMLETGQPLHAFDADKVSGGLIVRRAKKGEKIETIDNQKFILDNNVLVIADAKIPLAIAGIKGGKSSEVSLGTKKILIESANFEGVNIYKTSAALGLKTDASVIFSHNLSPELARIGMLRAISLLKELLNVKAYKPVDVYPKKQARKLLQFNINKINALIGVEFKEKEAVDILTKLGFQKSGKKLEIPALRMDIKDIEDVAEEIARIKGYDDLNPVSPEVALGVAQEEEIILFKDRIRNFLIGVGYDEVYNYSLVSRDETGANAAELANPMSKQVAVLRDGLANGLVKNLKDNLRFFDAVRIFEIGRVFSKAKGGVKETEALGIASSNKNAVLELKGLVDHLFGRLGIVDYFLPNYNIENKLLKSGEVLRIETGSHQVLGYLGSLGKSQGAVLEIDLEKLLKAVGEEREFEPLSKYPSIVRDISLLVGNDVLVGEIMALIQRASSKLVRDVDLIDWYQNEKLGDEKKSLTFRIVFQADDKTLTDAEADKEMTAINQAIAEKFDVELR